MMFACLQSQRQAKGNEWTKSVEANDIDAVFDFLLFCRAEEKAYTTCLEILATKHSLSFSWNSWYWTCISCSETLNNIHVFSFLILNMYSSKRLNSLHLSCVLGLNYPYYIFMFTLKLLASNSSQV